MVAYLTPDRYRTMGLGIDLTGKSPTELVAVIASASAEVNRYCAVPRGHDFRGDTIVGEKHQWDPGNTHWRTSGRVWPLHRPVRSVSKVDIFVTKQQHITFTPDMLYLNEQLNYVEPIAAPITTALFTAIPPWLLTIPIAVVDYVYGDAITETDERLYADGSKSYRATNQFWTDDDVTLKVDGSVVTTGFTIDRHEGRIIFSDLQDENSIIEVSYVHKLPYEIAAATSIVVSELLGYSNINASGLTGFSGVQVEEISLRTSQRSGFGVYDMHPAAKLLLSNFIQPSIA